VRALAADDLAPLASIGLDAAIAMRAMAQDMGWVLADGATVFGAATAYLADGTVFLDALVGQAQAKLILIDHVVAYARWSYAPAVTLLAPAHVQPLEARGFVGLDPSRLPPELGAVANKHKVLMKRL
jgi:hypothetical protein